SFILISTLYMFVLLPFINRILGYPTTTFQRIAISPFNPYLQHRIDVVDFVLAERVILNLRQSD
ncbi:hypothetical protein ACLH9T_004793, partial [Salmonella enterica]